jgi:hypothetical protein
MVHLNQTEMRIANPFRVAAPIVQWRHSRTITSRSLARNAGFWEAENASRLTALGRITLVIAEAGTVNLSDFATNRDLGYQTAALQMKIISKRASTREMGVKWFRFEVESEIPVSSRR